MEQANFVINCDGLFIFYKLVDIVHNIKYNKQVDGVNFFERGERRKYAWT